MTKNLKFSNKVLSGLLKKEEGLDVEFKRTTDAIESDDLVAFANSKLGGHILVGVNEIKTPIGLTQADVIGTKIGDHEKLKILNKAQDCTPPVEVHITYEKVDNKNIIIAYIPSGTSKPYCTKRGTYKTRGDGRNQALTPEMMFSIFLEREYKSFLEKFRIATSELQKEVIDIRDQVESSEWQITESLHEISRSAGDADANSQDIFAITEGLGDAIGLLDSKLEQHDFQLMDIEDRLNLLLKHHNIEDPYVTKVKEHMKFLLTEMIKKNIKRKRKHSKKHIIDDILIDYFKGRPPINRDIIEELYDSLYKTLKVIKR